MSVEGCTPQRGTLFAEGLVMLTNKVGRILGFTGAVGTLLLTQACEPQSTDVRVATQQDLSPLSTPTPPRDVRIPSNYVVKWTTCSNWIEGDLKLRNNSRLVKVDANGMIPLIRVEPNANGDDNHRKMKVNSWPKPLKGGTGLEVATKKPVEVIKLGQVINTKEPDGSVVQWVVSSWNLGNPVRGKNGRLAYQDTCFRNPNLVGKDTAGRLAEGTELSGTCVVEDMNTEYNALSAIYGPISISNYAGAVPMGNPPGTHPDGACYEGKKDGAHWYSATAAALNDANGTERDSLGTYFPGEEYCHFLVQSGYEVPAAKRPATKSYPAPGVISYGSKDIWRPVNPNVNIANDWEPWYPDPVEEPSTPTEDAILSSDTVPM